MKGLGEFLDCGLNICIESAVEVLILFGVGVNVGCQDSPFGKSFKLT